MSADAPRADGARRSAAIWVSPRSVLSWTLGATCFLLVIHVLARVALEIIDPDWTFRLFDVGQEMSIPTWFSQILLWTGATLAIIIALVERDAGGPARHWFFIGLLMAYASMDEGAAIHELLIVPMRELLGTSGGWLHFAWVVPFSLFVLLVIATLFRFWRALPTDTKRLTAASAVIFVSGAIVLEVAGAPLASDERVDSMAYFFTYTLEEALEMVGASIFIFALLNHLQVLIGDQPVRFYPRPGSSGPSDSPPHTAS